MGRRRERRFVVATTPPTEALDAGDDVVPPELPVRRLVGKAGRRRDAVEERAHGGIDLSKNYSA